MCYNPQTVGEGGFLQLMLLGDLPGIYLKRIMKNEVSRCLKNSGGRVSCMHVLLRYMHPRLKNARQKIWERPDKNRRNGKFLT
jgi:hypothetical protein